MERIRIGVLGAARITPMALIAPAKQIPEVHVAAVAARNPDRAARFARKHGIDTVHPSYDALLADPTIDAVYNPLPNALHFAWTKHALDRGKHVLCEKPFTSNADEAAALADLAASSGRVVMEAFHYRYHPLAKRMCEIAGDGTLGRVHHIETWMCIPLPVPGNIRYRYELAGGATMDVGSYAIHMLRHIAGSEPEVTFAQARMASPRVDRCMTAEFHFDDGRLGRIHCSLMSRTLLRVEARIRGEHGELRVINPVAPQLYHRFEVRTAKGRSRERFPSEATYTHQLRAFAGAILHGDAIPTGPTDSVANMRVIDAVYRKAQLPVRGS